MIDKNAANFTVVFKAEENYQNPRLLTGHVVHLPGGKTVVCHEEHRRATATELLDQWFMTPAEAIAPKLAEIAREYEAKTRRWENITPGAEAPKPAAEEKPREDTAALAVVADATEALAASGAEDADADEYPAMMIG